MNTIIQKDLDNRVTATRRKLPNVITVQTEKWTHEKAPRVKTNLNKRPVSHTINNQCNQIGRSLTKSWIYFCLQEIPGSFGYYYAYVRLKNLAYLLIVLLYTSFCFLNFIPLSLSMCLYHSAIERKLLLLRVHAYISQPTLIALLVYEHD